MINFLKIFFPGLMVTGALGSLILNIIVFIFIGLGKGHIYILFKE